MDIRVGDIVKTKKKYPCGGDNFEIERAGMDFRMKCSVCSKQIWISRVNLEKRIISIQRKKQ